MKILIVDDREENRYLLESLFQSNGFEIHSANNGKQALEILALEKIDLIISDILMPEMDGYQLCREVKNHKLWKEIPFVFYTATYTSRQDEVLALKLGAVRFIRKPMEPQQFIGIIHDIIEKVEKGEIKDGLKQYKTEKEVLKLYNEQLIKKLEKKMLDLEKGHARFSEIFERVPVMLTLYDPRVATLVLNKEFQRVTGWTQEDTKTVNIIEACYPDPAYLRKVSKFMSSAKKGWGEFRVTCKDGHIIDSLWSNILMPDGVQMGVGIDVTHRKVAERKLAEAEALYRTIFESTGTATLIVNEDTSIALVNHEFEVMTGYKAEEIVGQKWTEFVVPESLDRMLQYHRLRREKPGTAPKKYEVRLFHKKGQILYALLDVGLIPGTTESVVSILDITDRRETEERYSNLVKNLPVGIFRSTPEGRVISANPAMAKIYGYDSVTELLEVPAEAYYAQSGDREKMLQLLESRGVVLGYETRENRRDGSTIWVSTNYSAIRDPKGRIRYIDGVVLDITDRKIAGLKLRESEQKYKLLIENQTDMVVKVNSAGELVYISPSYCETFGKTEAELIGKSFLPLIHEEDRAATEEAMKALYQPPYSCYLEQRAKTKEGWRWLAWADKAVLDDDGNIVEIIGVGRDITDRKRAEEALQESETRLSTIVESEPECVKLLDPDGKLMEMNPAGLALIEADSLEQVIGTPMIDLLTPDYRAAFRALNERVFAGGSGTLEFEIVGLKGTRRWLETHAVPLRNALGVITFLMGLTRDITARKQADLALQESEVKFRNLAENIPGVIYLCRNDERYTMTYISAGVEELTGYSSKEFIADKISLSELFYPEDKVDIRRQVDEALAQRRTFHLTYRIKHKNGEWRWVEETGVGIFEKDELQGLEGYLQDVTDRIKTDEALKRAKQEYEQIFQSVGHPMMVLAKDQTILEANQVLQNLLHLKSDQIVGRKCYELMHQLDKSPDYCPFQKMLDSDTFESYTMPVEDLGRHYIVTCTPIKNSAGDIDRVIHVSTDITAQMKAEKELRESEEKFRTFFEQSGDAVYIAAPEGRLIFVNRAGLDLFGFTPEEAVVGNIQDLYVHPEEREIVTGEMRKKGHIKDYEVRLQRKDGQVIDCLLTSAARFDEEGKVISYQGIIHDITERKQREMEYLKLFTAVEQGPISVMITDINGDLEYVNPRFCELTGFSVEEVIGKNPRFQKSGHTSTGEYQKIWETITKGETWRGEFLNKKKNGELYWEDATIGPIRNSEGKTTHFIGMKIDITLRKKARKELEQIHRVYRKTIENSRGVPYILSHERNEYDFIGAGIENLLGIKSEEFSLKVLRTLVKERIITDREANISEIDEYVQAFLDGVVSRYQVDIRILTPDGKEKWVSDSASPYLDEDSEKVIGSMGILQDITERKAAEAELYYRIKLEKAIADISTQFIKVEKAGLDAEIHRALKSMGELTNVDRSRLALFSADGKSITNMYVWCAGDIEARIANFQDIPTDAIPWKMGKLLKFEHVYIPDVTALPEEAGSEKQILEAEGIKSLVAVPITYGEKLKGFLGLESLERYTAWDEEDITLLNTIGDIFANALEHKKAEDEKDNMQIQLQQSQRMEAIGTLAGGVAHDFNNLLTIIQGHAQLMMMDIEPDDPKSRDIKQILNAAARAAGLTRQLLLFSRKQAMEYAMININETIRNLLKMLGRLIGEDIALSTNLAPDVWIVEADEGNIEQVITNLTVNARDAMPNGGKLTIKSENIIISEEYCRHIQDSKPGRYVRISVEDRGTGIPEDIRKNIFEPFFSTKESGKGTGLGLSVVYGIIMKHGGWINVYSELGEGSNFVFYLPAKSGRPVQGSEGEAQLQLVKGHNERILIIEDEVGVREFVAHTLRKSGYSIFLAGDAREALDVFENQEGNFDLILSDVVLPDRNGLRLVEDLLEKNPKIPAIMCSGYTEEKVKQAIIGKKGLAFIQKPYNIVKLLTMIHETLHK